MMSPAGQQQRFWLVFKSTVLEKQYQLWMVSQRRQADLILLLLGGGNLAGRSIINSDFRVMNPIGVAVSTAAGMFTIAAAAVRHPWYTDSREMALLTLWLMSAFTFRVIFGTPLFLELCRHNALHPLWAARMTGVEAMVCCALMLRVRFLWALPTVAVNIALMTEVSGDVCRGPGLVAYPLLACRAATLVLQMLAAALTLTFIWVRETGNRNQFLRQLRFEILPNSEAG